MLRTAVSFHTQLFENGVISRIWLLGPHLPLLMRSLVFLPALLQGSSSCPLPFSLICLLSMQFSLLALSQCGHCCTLDNLIFKLVTVKRAHFFRFQRIKSSFDKHSNLTKHCCMTSILPCGAVKQTAVQTTIQRLPVKEGLGHSGAW